MKILVVTNLFSPDRGGGASVFSDMCFGLAERGHEVTVYTTYPYYPEWKNKAGTSAWRTLRETVRGVDVHRYGMFIPRDPKRLLTRVPYELSFAISLLRSLFHFRKHDVVMVYCPMPGAVLYSSIRKLFYREPLWLNVQDIPADAAAASGMSRSKLFNRFGLAVQSWLFNRGDVWSTIAPAMVVRLNSIRKRDQPVHYCPNFLNGTMADAIEEHAGKPPRSQGGPLRLLYAGNIGKKQGLRAFCKSLNKTDLAFHFRIHGNGADAEVVKDWVEQSGGDRFEFGDFLGEEEFVAALMESDFFVITEKAGVGASFVPSKLIPCIATGTPLLCVCDQEGPLGCEVSEFQLGISVPWPQIESLSSRIESVLAKEKSLAEMQANALRRSKFYSRKNVIDKFELELKRTSGYESSAD